MIRKDGNFKDVSGVEWTVGAESYPGECVAAGDRVIFRSMRLVEPDGNIVPDADGMLPHMTFRPSYARLTDTSRLEDDSPLQGSVFGPSNTSGVLRMDFGSFYCRWGGNFAFEGGRDDLVHSSKVIVSWYIDRGWRQRNPHINQDWADTRSFTVYNLGDGLRTARPLCASSVIVPGGAAIELDFGPGTTSVSIPATAIATPVPMGPFTFVRNVSGVAIGALKFNCQY